MFTDIHEKLEIMVNIAHDLGMKIVLVHYHKILQNIMDKIECQTPYGLVISGLYENIIVPLYDTGVYWKTSLHHILLSMNA